MRSRLARRRLTQRLLATVAAIALTVALRGQVVPPAKAQPVGTAAAVNPRSTGAPPSGAPRVLEIGAGLVRDERIATGPAGSVQVLLVDKTTLNVGPNSDLVLDEFVYDPQAGTGRLAASIAKGALRFVGGNVSHTTGATIRAPNATLGIRGGVIGLRIVGQETRVVLQYGTLTVTTPYGSVVVRRPGFMVVIGPAGFTGPFRVSQAEMDLIFAATTSLPGQTGGRRGPVVIPPLELGGGLLPGCDALDPACRPGGVEGRADEIVRRGNQTASDRFVQPANPRLPPVVSPPVVSPPPPVVLPPPLPPPYGPPPPPPPLPPY
jgi:hypothetical protein